MEQTDTARPADGSIADIAARLALWGRRAPDGLARVEFDSEFSRLKVVEQLSALCAEANIPFYQIDIPQSTPAPEIVQFLKDKMAPLPHGIVSLAGWPTAFPPNEPPLNPSIPPLDWLRVLNYNRENLTQFPLCQIWWLTRPLAGEFIRSIPDLNSWFIVRLSLTENIASPLSADRLAPVPLASPEQQESARRRAADLAARFANALKADVSLPDLASLANAAASHLDDVGLGREARECSAALVKQIRQTAEYRRYEAGTLNLNDRQQSILLDHLSHLYRLQNKDTIAAGHLEKVLATAEKISGPDNETVARILGNLAYLYQEQGLLSKSEPLYRRSLAMSEKALGPEHPDVATNLNNLAGLYGRQNQFSKAEPLYKRALAIVEKSLGREHPFIAASLNNLALLYESQHRFSEAEPLFERALALSEKALGPEHPDVATSLNNLAALYERQGRFSKAEPLYKRALAVWEKALGTNHPNVATVLENYSELLNKLGRKGDAAWMVAEAKGIREKLARDNTTV